MYRRAVAAVIKDEAVLMVQHQHEGRGYWTLPGGGLEPGETFAQAAVRELWEETGLRARVGRLLYQTEGEVCFLLEPEPEQEPIRGYDPELAPDQQMISAIAWKPLRELTEDVQVAKILVTLNQSREEWTCAKGGYEEGTKASLSAVGQRGGSG